MLVAEAGGEIQRAGRVLIRGKSGSGKSAIMRTVAGARPWGRGAIRLPIGTARPRLLGERQGQSAGPLSLGFCEAWNGVIFPADT